MGRNLNNLSGGILMALAVAGFPGLEPQMKYINSILNTEFYREYSDFSYRIVSDVFSWADNALRKDESLGNYSGKAVKN